MHAQTWGHLDFGVQQLKLSVSLGSGSHSGSLQGNKVSKTKVTSGRKKSQWRNTTLVVKRREEMEAERRWQGKKKTPGSL